MLDFVRQAGIIAGKDLLLELRSRGRIASMLVFAALVAVVFAFALDPTEPVRDVAGAMLWVTVVLAALLGLGRAYVVDREEDALTGLLLTPVNRGALFIGKVVANLVLLLITELIIFPVYGLFFQLPLWDPLPTLALVVVLASVGVVAVGTLFGAMTISTRLGETLLPVLLLPLVIPVVIYAASATQRLLVGRPTAEVLGSLKMLLAFDIVFLVVCTLAYPSVVEE
ncbi:MAG TPA: heme exporter protein CcmB [Longimicrobiaceae bacterium]